MMIVLGEEDDVGENEARRLEVDTRGVDATTTVMMMAVIDTGKRAIGTTEMNIARGTPLRDTIASEIETRTDEGETKVHINE